VTPLDHQLKIESGRQRLERRCKPHISLGACGRWWCQRGMIIGTGETVASAWAEYEWYARQMGGAA
jgi:hypothetical protein